MPDALDVRTARDLVILDLLEHKEIDVPKRLPLIATAEEQSRVWRQVDARRKAGDTTIDVEGLTFTFAGPPAPPRARRVA